MKNNNKSITKCNNKSIDRLLKNDKMFIKSIYTNSLWINKQIKEFQSKSYCQSSILLSNQYNRRLNNYNKSTINKIDSTSNLIHNSIKYYVNSLKHKPMNKKYEKPKAPPEPLNGIITTPFEVLLHGYLLHRIIGRGSFSTLYEASRLFVSYGGVACKHVRIDNFKENNIDDYWRINMQQKFINEEIRILRKIQHINIIQFYEIIIDNLDYYIMMKYASNGTISQYLYQFYQKPLPETYAKRWTKQLLSAIEYLHDHQSIVHRDLKLENFLLDEKYNALLTDFGLAISLSIDSDSINNNIDERIKCIENLLSIQCGTTEYIAPEIILNQQQQHELIFINKLISIQSTYDPFKADIYSMGICLFEMLNYYRPFRCTTFQHYSLQNHYLQQQYDYYYNIFNKYNRKYQFNKKIYLTQECRTLIYDMLEPRSTLRPTAKQLLQYNWFKYSIR